MVMQAWIALGSLIGVTIGQIVIGLFGGRLKRLEDAVEKIRTKYSEKETDTQRVVGEMQVQMAVLMEWKRSSDMRRLERGENWDHGRRHQGQK